MKEQDLDLKITRYFFNWNELLYNSVLFEKNVDMLDFVISIGTVYDHKIAQHVDFIMLLCFFSNPLLLGCFLLLNKQYLHKYWDFIAWPKFMDISIYKITEEYSVSQTKKEHI